MAAAGSPVRPADAAEATQKKTFQRWINAKLVAAGKLPILDISRDLSSGEKFAELLLAISDPSGPIKLGTISSISATANPAAVYLKKVGNVGECLKFIQSNKVRLENIGPEDMVGKGDSPPSLKLTLGCVWSIIDKWDISNISEENSNSKDALLKWCQRKTKDALYKDKGVSILNFDRSWKDGLGFCALIHAHKPGLIPFETLSPANAAYNLELAFKTAEDLGIPRFMDVEDITDNVKPDDKSIMSYVAQYFKYFSLGNKADLAAKSIASMAKFNKEIKDAEDEYLLAVKPLIAWVKAKTEWLTQLDCKNSPEETKSVYQAFNVYHNDEKPAKAIEFSRAENLFNALQLRLRSANRPPFEPGIGLSMNELDVLWADLGKIEHEKSMYINSERKRQERIAEIEAMLNQKIKSIQEWTAKKQEYLTKKETITSITAANTMLKLQESFEKEYKSNRTRLEPLDVFIQQLTSLNASKIQQSKQSSGEVRSSWDKLQQLSEAKREFIESGLAREKAKDSACKEYAEIAKDGRSKLKNKLLGLKKTGFGSTKSEVQHYEKVMNDEEREISADAEKIRQNLDKAMDAMVALGMSEDEKYRYTSVKIQDVMDSHKELKVALELRRADWLKALEQQEKMEQKRQEYANLALSLEAKIRRRAKEAASYDDGDAGTIFKAIHSTCSELKEPNECLEVIKAEYNMDEINAELQAIERVDRECREMGITSNEYTTIEVPKLAADVKFLSLWVTNFKSELATEQLEKERYQAESSQLFKELQKCIEQLADMAALADNSLAGVTVALKNFQAWRMNDKSKYSSQLLKIKQLFNRIQKRIDDGPEQENLFMVRPRYEPSTDKAKLDSAWSRLEKAEQERLSKLEKEAAVQSTLEQLSRAFNASASELDQWIQATQFYLKQTEKIETLETATLQLTSFDNIVATFKIYEEKRKTLEKMAADIAACSTFAGKYKKLPDVEEHLKLLQSQFEELPALQQAKHQALTEARIREQEKETARLDFAQIAGDLKSWLKQATLRINIGTGGFGTTLSEVRAKGVDMKVEVESVNSQVASKMDEMIVRWNRLKELGVSSDDLGHTTITCEELESLQHQLVDRQNIRDRQWQEELAKQEQMETARLTFASAATSLEYAISNIKSSLEQLSGPSATVLAAFPEKYPLNLDELSADVEAANQDCVKQLVKDNEHTDLTVEKLNTRRQDLQLWVSSFKVDLEEETAEIKKYNERAAELTAWIAKDTALLKQRIDSAGAGDTEVDLIQVRAAIDAHQGWRTTEKAAHSAIQGELKLQRDKIELLLKDSVRKRPNHIRPPFTPAEGQSVEDIERAWNSLDAVDSDRSHRLQEQLARQEKIFMLITTFAESLDALTKWIAEKEVYFSEDKPIEDLITAQVRLSELEATEVEIKTAITKRKALEDIVKTLHMLGYREISTLEQNCLGVIKRFNELWKEPPLESKASNKRDRLMEAVKREQVKELTRLKWAETANKYNSWFKTKQLDVSSTSSKFGNTLQSLEAFRAELKRDDAQVELEITQREEAARAVWAELERLNIGPNDLAHTSATLPTLLELTSVKLREALANRNAAYDAELKRQQNMEAKRREFCRCLCSP